MSTPGQEIQIEYDDVEQNCYVMLGIGKTIGLGTTDREALQDLREAAHFYIDTTIDLKLQEMSKVAPE